MLLWCQWWAWNSAPLFLRALNLTPFCPLFLMSRKLASIWLYAFFMEVICSAKWAWAKMNNTVHSTVHMISWLTQKWPQYCQQIPEDMGKCYSSSSVSLLPMVHTLCLEQLYGCKPYSSLCISFFTHALESPPCTLQHPHRHSRGFVSPNRFWPMRVPEI